MELFRNSGTPCILFYLQADYKKNLEHELIYFLLLQLQYNFQISDQSLKFTF
jgi:hypothetical protein